MTGFLLRIIAMTTMVTDHVAYYLMDDPDILRLIGRIAFPVYAFLLAEGFIIISKDKNKKRIIKHISLLIFLVLISEICCDIMEFKFDFANYLESQSNMITLLMGFLGMILTEVLFPLEKTKKNDINIKNVTVLITGYAFMAFTNYMLEANFNFMGPLLVIAFYWLLRLSRNHANNTNKWNWVQRFLALLLIFSIYVPIYFWVRSGFGNVEVWLKEMTDYLPWIIGHFFAALILSFSNGVLGYHEKWFKYLYTYFYPAHALIIGIIAILIGR